MSSRLDPSTRIPNVLCRYRAVRGGLLGSSVRMCALGKRRYQGRTGGVERRVLRVDFEHVLDTSCEPTLKGWWYRSIITAHDVARLDVQP